MLSSQITCIISLLLQYRCEIREMFVFRGGTVMLWFKLFPHSKKVLGLILAQHEITVVDYNLLYSITYREIVLKFLTYKCTPLDLQSFQISKQCLFS